MFFYILTIREAQSLLFWWKNWTWTRKTIWNKLYLKIYFVDSSATMIII